MSKGKRGRHHQLRVQNSKHVFQRQAVHPVQSLHPVCADGKLMRRGLNVRRDQVHMPPKLVWRRHHHVHTLSPSLPLDSVSARPSMLQPHYKSKRPAAVQVHTRNIQLRCESDVLHPVQLGLLSAPKWRRQLSGLSRRQNFHGEPRSPMLTIG